MKHSFANLPPDERRAMAQRGRAARTVEGVLTPAAVRFLRRWRAERKSTGKRLRPLRRELCARYGVSASCIEDAISGRRYGWVQ